MTRETFFEKFELLANTTNAIAKMRELILQLAVQGKLVGRKPDEGDACTTYAAIPGDRALHL